MNPECLLCSSKTEKIHHRTIADYYHCRHCEFIFKDEQHIISEREELKIYNRHNNSIDDPRYVAFLSKFLKAAVFDYVRDGKGLDFGSGPSPVLAQILGNHGYDMDIYDLFYAPEKVYIGKQYDLVTSTEVVEHLRDPLQYFRLFRELLKPDGILAIMTLFHPNDDSQFLRWHYIQDWSHISFYTSKTMEFIASRVGLQVIYTDNVRYVTFALDE